LAKILCTALSVVHELLFVNVKNRRNTATMTIIDNTVSLSEARHLLTRGTPILGPDEIQSVFRINIPDPPPVPFTGAELETARDLDQFLVLRPDGVTMKGIFERRGNMTARKTPLLSSIGWYRGERFFTDHRIQLDWALVGRGLVPDSTDANYLRQTRALVAYLRGSVFPGAMPNYVETAIGEFASQQAWLESLIVSDWKAAAARFTTLRISKLFRETPADVLWTNALYEAVNGIRLLPGYWTWTQTLSSDGGVVDVGGFGESGMSVSSGSPWDHRSHLGLRFARSGGHRET
jgi:hypothetical protein